MKEIVSGDKIVTFIVKDLDNAKKFYVEKLGFPVDEEKYGQFFVVNAGHFRLCVDKEDGEDKARGGGASMIIEVKDVDRVAKQLETHGIKFLKNADSGGGVRVYLTVRDPEGYKIIFSERL